MFIMFILFKLYIPFHCLSVMDGVWWSAFRCGLREYWKYKASLRSIYLLRISNLVVGCRAMSSTFYPSVMIISLHPLFSQLRLSEGRQ